MYVSIDAPKFTFVRSENSHIVCMIWTTSNCTVTLNGKKYMNGTWIEQEGEYAFVITNDAKRSTTYKLLLREILYGCADMHAKKLYNI